MDKISICNPNAVILKHLNISVGKIEREAGRYVGMYLSNGFKFENHFDVFGFVLDCKKKNIQHITFGKQHCNNKENVTGCCKGHNPGSAGAPIDFKVTASSADEFKSIKNTHFGKLLSTNETKDARCGDYITLENPDTKEKIKLVVTSTYISKFSSERKDNITNYVGVALVMQREKPNVKVQYFI